MTLGATGGRAGVMLSNALQHKTAIPSGRKIAPHGCMSFELGHRTNGFSARNRWYNETGARVRAAVRSRSSTSERSKRGTQFGAHRWVRCVLLVYFLTLSR